MRPSVMAATLATALVAAVTAHAGPTEVEAAFAVSPGRTSDYRTAANGLGYDQGLHRLSYEAEVAALVHVAWRDRIAVGPLLRGDLGRLIPPYDGLESIRADGAFMGVREEVRLDGFTGLFVWSDQTLGLTSIGLKGASTTLLAWGLRFGLGIRGGNDLVAARFRVGYAWTPTFNAVTAHTGPYDFGGFFFAIDGVLRVMR